MKIIRRGEAPSDSRPNGRTVRTLFQQEFDEPVSSIVFYLCEVPSGKFGAHYQSQSVEFIWFPTGGMIKVNGQVYEMNPWDGVLLEPGDVHGYDGDDCKDILHFAVKMPSVSDKVEVS
jgi:hypothetical protein